MKYALQVLILAAACVAGAAHATAGRVDVDALTVLSFNFPKITY